MIVKHFVSLHVISLWFGISRFVWQFLLSRLRKQRALCVFWSCVQNWQNLKATFYRGLLGEGSAYLILCPKLTKSQSHIFSEGSAFLIQCPKLTISKFHNFQCGRGGGGGGGLCIFDPVFKTDKMTKSVLGLWSFDSVSNMGEWCFRCVRHLFRVFQFSKIITIIWIRLWLGEIPKRHWKLQASFSWDLQIRKKIVFGV